MDPSNKRLLDELKDNESLLNLLRDIFETEANDEREQAEKMLLEGGDIHKATVHAVRSDTFRQVTGIILAKQED